MLQIYSHALAASTFHENSKIGFKSNVISKYLFVDGNQGHFKWF